jgi:hypothetical protein
MGIIIRETVKRQSVSFIRILLLIILTVGASNIAAGTLLGFNPVLNSLVPLLIIGIGVHFCYKLIMQNTSEYVLKVIDDDFIIERKIGKRINGIFGIRIQTIKELREFDEKKDKYISSRNKFICGKDKTKWVVVDYVDSRDNGKVRKIVIQARTEFIDKFKKALVKAC